MDQAAAIIGRLGPFPLAASFDVPKAPWYGPFLPLIPGLAVTIFGFWIVHKLAEVRELRKEIRELCSELKEVAQTVADCAQKAWEDTDPQVRLVNVQLTKRQVSSLGIKATNLKNFSKKVRYLTLRSPIEINLVKEVFDFRRVVTADPFEDSSRGTDPIMGSAVLDMILTFESAVDSRLTAYLQGESY